MLLLGACGDVASPVPPGPGPSQLLSEPTQSDQYIVVFQDAVAQPDSLARMLVSTLGGTLRHTYQTALKGFAAHLSDAAVVTLRADPLVAYVEPDQVVRPDATQQMDVNGDPWGLDRIDQRALPLDRRYTYESTGAGVHAYLIDTGIWTSHPEFGGRADIVYDAFGLDGTDCSGHGTAVAGVVGAATYGVAKEVFLHGVRVYSDCAGSGFASDVVAGVDWVAAHHVRPAVANLSVSLNPSTALTTAVRSLWNAGVFVVATAANHNADACLEAGGASGAFTVAAATRSDAKASFSNWGPCVDIYAPGEDIKTTWLGGLTKTLSGTSFAAPHVSGVAALYKATFGDAPSDSVANWIVTRATAGVITGNPVGTPNLLLHMSTSAPTGVVRIIGGGAIGSGSATPGSNRQDFDFNVTNTNGPGGRLFLRDFRFVRRDGSVASLTADPTWDAATGIRSFTRTSDACVTFGGIGRVDTGQLVAFSVDACDHGAPGAGVDFFGLSVPYFNYSKSGTLSEGEITWSSAAGVRVTAGSAIGPGGATPGSDRQEFNFDVTNAPGGRLFVRDFRFVRRDGSVGSLTADPAVDAATGIRSFTQTSFACVTFGGTGRVDTGELVGFSVDACDNGSPGAGVDVFGLKVPYFAYSKSGTLTEGEITLSMF